MTVGELGGVVREGIKSAVKWRVAATVGLPVFFVLAALVLYLVMAWLNPGSA